MKRAIFLLTLLFTACRADPSISVTIDGQPGPTIDKKKLEATKPDFEKEDFRAWAIYGLLGSALRPHGLTVQSPEVMVASLDHAIWFHRPFRVDEWLLAAQRPLVTDGARGLALGQVYDRAGTLVAPYTQEALMRT